MMPSLTAALRVVIWLACVSAFFAVGMAAFTVGFYRGLRYARRAPFSRDWESKRRTVKALTGHRPRCVASLIWVGSTGEEQRKDGRL